MVIFIVLTEEEKEGNQLDFDKSLAFSERPLMPEVKFQVKMKQIQ